jgi:hypothetical protein
MEMLPKTIPVMFSVKYNERQVKDYPKQAGSASVGGEYREINR